MAMYIPIKVDEDICKDFIFCLASVTIINSRHSAEVMAIDRLTSTLQPN